MNWYLFVGGLVFGWVLTEYIIGTKLRVTIVNSETGKRIVHLVRYRWFDKVHRLVIKERRKQSKGS